MEAAMQGSAEFFAPLIETRPRSGRPPLMRNLSISVVDNPDKVCGF
jgi:hypothetical protein